MKRLIVLVIISFLFILLIPRGCVSTNNNNDKSPYNEENFIRFYTEEGKILKGNEPDIGHSKIVYLAGKDEINRTTTTIWMIDLDGSNRFRC